ncbi:MAG TPA: hypothetical protein VEB21_03655, partial [Terriglobales bacterium]|nr:hypothetical protein [Terriglobales bacterium]
MNYISHVRDADRIDGCHLRQNSLVWTVRLSGIHVCIRRRYRIQVCGLDVAMRAAGAGPAILPLVVLGGYV